MIDFPSSPAVGAIVTSPSGVQWRWDGSAWLLASQGGGARGAVGYAQITANRTNISEAVQVGLSVSFVANPGRTYRTTVFANFIAQVAGANAELFIYNGGPTKLQSGGAGALSTTYKTGVITELIETGLSGTVTRNALAGSNIGIGVTLVAAPNNPAFILVEDITYEAGSGAAAVPPATGAMRLLGYAYGPNSNSAMGTTPAQISGMVVAWTADPTRKYKVTAEMMMNNPTAAIAVGSVAIADAANNVARQTSASVPAGGINGFVASYIYTGLSGPVQRFAVAYASVGGLYVEGMYARPAYMEVVEIA